MSVIKAFRSLTRGEWALWLTSLAAVTLSFLLAPGGDPLTLTASLIGVTALIFVAKGMVLGQVLTVVFAVFYGIISFFLRYYGEMITYLGMTSPIALAAVISWLRHPYKDSGTVAVHRLTKKQAAVILLLAACVTAAFYFILRALGNAAIVFSTVSVATSFLASALTLYRSPWYALAYAANDAVLIVLWILAAAADVQYLPMVICFTAFLANDLYGFVNWRRMAKRQENACGG